MKSQVIRDIMPFCLVNSHRCFGECASSIFGVQQSVKAWPARCGIIPEDLDLQHYLVGVCPAGQVVHFFYDNIAVDLKYHCQPCRNGNIETPYPGVWSVIAELKCVHNTGRLKKTLPLLCFQLCTFEGKLISFVCMSLQECLLFVNIFSTVDCCCLHWNQASCCKAVWREWS